MIIYTHVWIIDNSFELKKAPTTITLCMSPICLTMTVLFLVFFSERPWFQGANCLKIVHLNKSHAKDTRYDYELGSLHYVTLGEEWRKKEAFYFTPKKAFQSIQSKAVFGFIVSVLAEELLNSFNRNFTVLFNPIRQKSVMDASGITLVSFDKKSRFGRLMWWIKLEIWRIVGKILETNQWKLIVWWESARSVTEIV